MEASFFGALAAHGLPGLIIFAMGAWIVMLHRELRDERRARIDDVKQYNDKMSAMQERALGTADKLSDVMTEIKDRDREREMREPRRLGGR